MKRQIILLFFFGYCNCFFSYSQNIVNIYVDSTKGNINNSYRHGVFYVPKTVKAQTDFFSNGNHQNSIRLNVIESALNNNTNLNDCIKFLDTFKTSLQFLSTKTNKLMFVIAKMPVWLSSSSDGSAASSPGWYVLNTKPPANYANWNTVVQSVVNRIVNNYGISNAQFEIWNEPDIGSWTGTKSEYFELFKNTFEAIKSVNSNLEVGGPATNQWAKNINNQPPYGYINNTIANTSLIGELIDSMTSWNKSLDFISWHDFDVSHQSNENAVQYIQQKYAALSQQTPQFVISEWNLPSAIRETSLHKTAFLKNQIEMAKLNIDNHMVAAWQDFDSSSIEFHKDYGLLSYGGIHKPYYKALLLTNMLKGNKIKVVSNKPIDVISTISNDTLSVLIVNYTPPPFLAAFNHTLFDGHLNVTQLDSIGFINISTNNMSPLDSIYKGLITINNTNSIHQAVNNSIPIFEHFDSLENNSRRIQLHLIGLQGNFYGKKYTIDSTVNNLQFKFDSLITKGFTQNGAISYITNNQSFDYQIDSIENARLNVKMQANSISLYQFIIPQLSSSKTFDTSLDLSIFPNPTNNKVIIECSINIGKLKIMNMNGKLMETIEIKGNRDHIDISKYPSGLYFFHFNELNNTVKIIRK